MRGEAAPYSIEAGVWMLGSQSALVESLTQFRRREPRAFVKLPKRITKRDQIKEWVYCLQVYGHGDISISDFGWWHCRTCDQSGDDYDSPRDHPCKLEHV